MEEVIINDGKVATTHFGEYKIPTIKDVPVFKGSVTEAPHGAGPYDSMPIGETGNIPDGGGDRQRGGRRLRRAHQEPADHGGKDLPSAARREVIHAHGSGNHRSRKVSGRL